MRPIPLPIEQRLHAPQVNLAPLASMRGNHAAAIPYYERALELVQADPNASGEYIASLFYGLGLSHEVAGDRTDAMPYYEQAVRIYGTAPTASIEGVREEVVRITTLLGVFQGRQGNHAAAIAYYEQALEFVQADPNASGRDIADVSYGLALATPRRGKQQTRFGTTNKYCGSTTQTRRLLEKTSQASRIALRTLTSGLRTTLRLFLIMSERYGSTTQIPLLIKETLRVSVLRSRGRIEVMGTKIQQSNSWLDVKNGTRHSSAQIRGGPDV